jgi:hypothetical protein
MTTKIVIKGKPGEAINGKSMFVEVDGIKLEGEVDLSINAHHGEVATATVKMILPEMEYRDE